MHFLRGFKDNRDNRDNFNLKIWAFITIMKQIRR